MTAPRRAPPKQAMPVPPICLWSYPLLPWFGPASGGRASAAILQQARRARSSTERMTVLSGLGLAQRRYLRQQVLLVDRLEDVVLGPLADSPDLVGLLVLAGAQDHGDVLRLLVAGDDAGRLVPVHLGHDDVHQDQVRLLRLRLGDRLLSARGEAAAVAVPREHVGKRGAVGGGVVDDEDFPDRHGAHSTVRAAEPISMRASL